MAVKRRCKLNRNDCKRHISDAMMASHISLLSLIDKSVDASPQNDVYQAPLFSTTSDGDDTIAMDTTAEDAEDIYCTQPDHTAISPQPPFTSSRCPRVPPSPTSFQFPFAPSTRPPFISSSTSYTTTPPSRSHCNVSSSSTTFPSPAAPVTVSCSARFPIPASQCSRAPTTLRAYLKSVSLYNVNSRSVTSSSSVCPVQGGATRRQESFKQINDRLVLEDSDDSIEDDLETYRDGSISNCNYSSDGGGSDTDCTRKGTLTFSEILKRRLAHNHHPPHSIFPRPKNNLEIAIYVPRPILFCKDDQQDDDVIEETSEDSPADISSSTPCNEEDAMDITD